MSSGGYDNDDQQQSTTLRLAQTKQTQEPDGTNGQQQQS
jgi:hypothetical protein